MKKVTLTICLMLVLLTSGCAGRSGNLPYLPNEVGAFPIFVPGIFLAVKNINEVNAIMEAEKKADAEFGQLKNPVYFMKKDDAQATGFRSIHRF